MDTGISSPDFRYGYDSSFGCNWSFGDDSTRYTVRPGTVCVRIATRRLESGDQYTSGSDAGASGLSWSDPMARSR